jgi:hypothetical protein
VDILKGQWEFLFVQGNNEHWFWALPTGFAHVVQKDIPLKFLLQVLS